MGLPKSDFLYPINAIPTIATVTQNSPGERHGLQPKDTIVSVDGKSFDQDVISLIRYIKARPNQKTQLVIDREGTQKTIDVLIESKTLGNKTEGFLGIMFETASLPGYPFLKAVKEGIKLTNEFIYRTITGFFSIFAQKDIGQMSGPLMIVSMTIKGASQGLSILLFFLAIISINLAVLNLIPLPILDGGQILFYSLEALFRRQIPTRIKEYIHLASWILILLLILYISAKDIARIVTPHLTAVKNFFGFGK